MSVQPFIYQWEHRYCENDDQPRKVWTRKVKIPDGLILSVVFLFPNKRAAQNKESLGGTGFIAPYWDSWEEPFFYIVTNSHVVRKGGGAPAIRTNPFYGSGRIIQTEPSEWHHHPDGDDVAIRPYEYPSEYDGLVFTNDDYVTDEMIPKSKIGIGDQAFMLGRLDLKGNVLPSARFGNLCMMPAQPIENVKTGLRQESYLVEMYSSGGLSGSPVFIRKLPWSPDEDLRPPRQMLRTQDDLDTLRDEIWDRSQDRIWLLGVNWGHLPERMWLRDKSSDEPDPDHYIEGNRNVACVVPAIKILDILRSEALSRQRQTMKEDIERKRRKKASDEPLGAVPDVLPYPDSDLSPGLQQTIKDKIDRGEVDEVDADAFFDIMRRGAPQVPPEQDDEES